MKMKLLAWVFIPAVALGLAACDNAGNDDFGNPAGDGAAGSSTGSQSFGGSDETQPGQQDTATPPAGGGSSG